MEENKFITLDRSEYECLLRAQERIETLERLINKVEYINTAEVAAVLGIRTKVVANG